MENITYELFNFEDSIPFRMFIYKLGEQKPHWHKELELIYVLEGSAEITIASNIYNLKDEDIILINRYDTHYIKGENVVLLSTLIDLEKLGVEESEIDNLTFQCNSSIEEDKTPYNKIKALLASIVNYNLKYEDNSKYANLSIIYSLFAEFMNKYQVISNQKKVTINKSEARLREIIKYINSNYSKMLTLKDLSNEFNLTIPYISSFFTKYFGQSFQDYYDELRIAKSLSSLLEGKYTLDDLALLFGFSDSRAYVRAFKKFYNETPSEYKKVAHKKDKEPNSLTEFTTNKYLDKLLKNNDVKYQLPFKKHKNCIINDISLSLISTNSTINTKSYLNFFTVAHAKDFLNFNIRQCIEETLKEIPFKYVKFHSLFDDSLHVIKKKNGAFVYSFVYIDMILDYILSLNIKPLIELGFTPYALAKDKNFFDNGIILSECENDSDYLDLISAFLDHIIDRYKRLEVRTWPFTFWNAPDTSKYVYGFEDDSHFFKLYKQIYNLVKSKDSQIEMGSPSLAPLCKEMIEWDKNFLSFCQRNDCYPNFLIVHYFENNFSNYFNQINKEQFPTCSNNFSKYIDLVKSKNFYYGSKVYLTEFNFTTSHRNLLSDTIFNSCYIVKSIVENINRLDSFGHWYLTDLIDETQLPNNFLHGGLGFYTLNNIKKPSYYAYLFLSKLGEEILTKQEGIIVTKSSNKIIILLYNYEQYSSLYATGDYFNLSQKNRYIPFAENKDIVYNIKLTDVKAKSYAIKTTSINHETGSIYDLSRRLNVCDIPDTETTDMLKSLSYPASKFDSGTIVNNELSISAFLNPLEIKLIEITLK